jgi:hypothetical protein
LVHVLQRCNGLTVSDRRVLLDDLLAALFTMMESHQLTSLILGEDELTIDQIFEPVLKSQDEKSIYRSLNLILELCKSTDDQNLVTVIFRVLAERLDLSRLDASSFTGLLHLLLLKVERLEDDSVLQSLFIALLGRLQVADSKKELIGLLLSQIAKRAEREKDSDVKRWFREQMASYLPAQKTATTPLLPPGTVLYQEESSGRKIVVMEVDKAQRDIIYYSTPYESVGHPKLLFEFIMSGQSIMDCRIFAVQDGPLKPSSKLYRYPFGNVFQSYSACWPQLDEIAINHLTQLKNLPELFFNSPTNDHGFQGKNLRELFISLQGIDFDDSLLMDSGFTFADHFELLDTQADSIEENELAHA